MHANRAEAVRRQLQHMDQVQELRVAAEVTMEMDRYIVDARLSAQLADEETAFQIHRQYRPRR